MGDFFLSELDKQMERMEYCYVRFMDDILILTSTRGKLRKAVRRVHSFMESVRLSLHPCKTFIGRVSKGFDFLGYHFSGKGNVFTLAQKTIDNFLTKVRRLYEQDTRDITRIDDYVRRWLIWATSGVSLFDVRTLLLLVLSASQGCQSILQLLRPPSPRYDP